MTRNDPTDSDAARHERSRLAHHAWLCVPLAVWLAVIALDSTDVASSAHTDVLLLRFVRLFLPHEAGPGSSGFGALSWALRKTGHVVEYGILGLLLARGARGFLPGFARGQGRELLWRTAAVALPCGLAFSVLDEIHQTLVASRFGSPRDVAFDFAGLVIGVVVMWLMWRRQGREKAPRAAS